MGKYSKYKGVSHTKDPRTAKRTIWRAAWSYEGIKCYKKCDTEREAAIAYDKMRINRGLEPVNIFKRKIE